MAWQEVQPDLSGASPSAKTPVKARHSSRGGLFIALHRDVIASLDWRKGSALALLVGAGSDADGKIALKAKAHAPLKLEIDKVNGGVGAAGIQYGRVHVGRFPRLVAPCARQSFSVAHECRGDQLIIALPEGWLKA